MTNNSWSHYGFKSLKNKFFELEKNRLNLELNKTSDKKNSLIYSTLLANSEKEIQRYSKEMRNLKIKAITYDRDFVLLQSKCYFLSLSLVSSIFSLFAFLYQLVIKKFKEINFVLALISLIASFLLLIFSL